MPELPEVETMRRGILSAQGKIVQCVERTPCTRKPISIVPRIDRINRRMQGTVIDHVGRLGKRILLELNSGDLLVIEPRMTGLVTIEQTPNDAYTRFQITFARHCSPPLRFWDQRGLGTVRLFNEPQFREFRSNRIGIDALEIKADSLGDLLRKKRLEIKTALMDQRFVAGIGNIYASEVLHLAGVHPQARCYRLTRQQFERIGDATLFVLNKAIELEGSTLSDGTYRNKLNEPGGYQNHHQVYDRAGNRCLTCSGGTIRRIVQCGRSTYFCPSCQKKSASRARRKSLAG